MSTLVFDIETYPLKEVENEEAALSPFRSEIATLTIFDIEREKGVVYVNIIEPVPPPSSERFTIALATETEMLEKFWEGVRDYDVLAGFAVRSFDLPFMVHRSLINRIRPSIKIRQNKGVLKQSYPYQVDLKEEFSFSGLMTHDITLKNLAAAHSLSPDSILDHQTVKGLIASNQNKELTDHCINKILSTMQLYQIWKSNLAPAEFINSLDG